MDSTASVERTIPFSEPGSETVIALPKCPTVGHNSCKNPLFSAYLFAAFSAGLPSKGHEIDDKLPSNSS
jgi:hypothetical protein